MRNLENLIGEKGISTLSQVLKTNTTVTQLNLKGNLIDPSGAKLLGEALKVNTSLTDLNLSASKTKTPIRALGVKAITDALLTNTTLKTLELRNNAIGDSGASYIGNLIKVNKVLTSLDLYSKYEWL